MLQVVALLAMEPPGSGAPDGMRDEKAKVFHAIRTLAPEDLVRGQFRGYRQEEGVAPDSTVETFAAVRLDIDSWRWAGVPFFIRAGKCLPVTCTEILVSMHRPPQEKMGHREIFHGNNYFRFRLSPQIVTAVGALGKKPGETLAAQNIELTVNQQSPEDVAPVRTPARGRPERRQHPVRARGFGRGRLAHRRSDLEVRTRRSWNTSPEPGGRPRPNRLLERCETWHNPAVDGADLMKPPRTTMLSFWWTWITRCWTTTASRRT